MEKWSYPMVILANPHFPCTQERADTRIFFRIQNASVSGSNIVLVRTADNDVAVTGIGLFEKLNVTELWLWFDTGKNQGYIPVHSIASMQLFHALTRCDHVCFFAGRGKKNSWNTWEQYEKLTDVLNSISAFHVERKCRHSLAYC